MNIPALKLEGRSGCRLEVRSENERIIVRKTSNSISYNARLIKQARKQQQFYEDPCSLDFFTPQVISVFEGNGEEPSSFDMHYVHAEKYSDHLERLSVHSLERLIERFFRHLDALLKKSTYAPADPSVFHAKRSELESKLRGKDGIDHALLAKTYAALENIPSQEIPLGFCHGDFTFSNILFYEQDIFLLDFLDSFVETPLVDLVKLRQDTRYKWTLLVEKDLEQYRKNKIVQIFDHMDRKIVDYLAARPQIKDWCHYLQIFNILRILPYVEAKEEIQFVETTLNDLIQSCN